MSLSKSDHVVDILSLFFPMLSNDRPDNLKASPSLVTMLSLSKEISPIPMDNLASQSCCLSGVVALSFALSAMATVKVQSGLSTTIWKLSPRYISSFMRVRGRKSVTHTFNASNTVCLHSVAIFVEFTRSPVITPFIIILNNLINAGAKIIFFFRKIKYITLILHNQSILVDFWCIKVMIQHFI